LRVEVAQLKEKFMTQAQALLHGDLHTGSIMVNQHDTYVIDSEFAFYGPIGFDIGALIGNLLLSYASHEVRTKDAEQRTVFRKYLTDTIVSVWTIFKREFQKVAWEHVDQHDMPLAYQKDYMHRILQDAAGFAGAKINRRVIGLAGVVDIRGIEDVTDRSIAASLALNMGQALIKGRHNVNTIEDIVTLATNCKPSYPWNG
jgi:5-methylthioribose kinase